MNTHRMVMMSLVSLLSLPLCASGEDPMHPSFLFTIVEKLKNGENITYTKYGDGEYYCMAGRQGANCDGDMYHQWLGERLKAALISLSQKPNTYIGKWWHTKALEFCEDLAQQHQVTIPWTWYHLVMNDDEALERNYMHHFAKFIINTKRKKILMCNKKNTRLNDFFRADVFIEIPEKCWSLEYETWRDKVEQVLEPDCILLIAGGLCSKVLIDDITNRYAISCIDLGSSFDLLAQKKNTRGWHHTYKEEFNYYKDLLPEDWQQETQEKERLPRWRLRRLRQKQKAKRIRHSYDAAIDMNIPSNTSEEENSSLMVQQ